MAAPKSRRSRKRRKPQAAPRPTPSARRPRRADREAPAARQTPAARRAAEARQPRRGERALGTFGEPPQSPFGGLPVSEVAIFLGAVSLVVGLIAGGPALIVGVVVVALGVIEFTAREHFSGYRSHATLLAGMPAVGLEIALVLTLGQPRHRGLLLLPVVPVFGILFWALRKRFLVARQARVARLARQP